MKDLFGDEMKTARFSPCGQYRYMLYRQWSDKPAIAFIGLNPSTANEQTDDATIARVRKIAAYNGFGGFYMLNLFGIISSNPDYIDQVEDPVGPENDRMIRAYVDRSEFAVACWGNFKQAARRESIVRGIVGRERLRYLHINLNGSPKHPLYCKTSTKIFQLK